MEPLQTPGKKKKKKKKPENEEEGSSFLDDQVEADDDGDDDDDDISKYILFDLETQQDTGVHITNLSVAHRVCQYCLDQPVTETSACHFCGGKNEHIFYKDQPLKRFCEWLFSPQNKGAVVLAHNAKSFDLWPILKYLYSEAIVPEIIFNGAKIMNMKVAEYDIVFRDSLNFFQMPLAALPKAFGLKELAKGYWPYFFNTPENEGKVFPQLPDTKYYGVEQMKPEARETFIKWHAEHKMDEFDFDAELLKYGRSDVDILRQAVLAFRKLFMDMTSALPDVNPLGLDVPNRVIDPFKECITIASACNKVFRSKFLEPNTIGLIPAEGYVPKHNQSVKALQWLKYISHKDNIRIQHAKNGGEVTVAGHKVDGYYEDEQGVKHCLEYDGCFFHGHMQCFKADTVNPVNGFTMGELYEKTIKKHRDLERLGYRVHTTWECEFDRQIAGDAEVKNFIDSLEVTPALEPRHALMGGRTNAIKLFHECGPGQKIFYNDFTSLYPDRNKNCCYPTGHPKIITENFGPLTLQNLKRYQGLMKCKILPPRGLYIPLLGYRCNGKLVVPLCRTCTEMHTDTAGCDPLKAVTVKDVQCSHTDDERALTGTWVTLEIQKALELGYKMQYIYEVWHFDKMVQYDPVMKTGGLFAGYINTFLKIKQEASGWPQWCSTEADKRKYVEDYERVEGVQLSPECIEKNPGLRSLSKLILNSFWGKFCERPNMAKTTHTNDPCDFFELVGCDEKIIKNIEFIGDEMARVDWAYKEEFVEGQRNVNVIIGAFTTAHARLKLYGLLEKTGHRTLYFDTDSVIYYTDEGEEDLLKSEMGDFLGQLTAETDSPIRVFVSGGPKNYAFTTFDGQTEMKVKGITLNYINKKVINLETLRDMVQGGGPDYVEVTNPNKICRDVKNTQLISKEETKRYKIVYNKRVLQRDGISTLPYGY
jgi:hypothetical protein